MNYEGRHALRGRPYDRNPFTIGISLVGTFQHDDEPTQAQLNALSWLIGFIQAEIPTINTIESHWTGDGYLGSWSNRFMRRP